MSEKDLPAQGGQCEGLEGCQDLGSCLERQEEGLEASGNQGRGASCETRHKSGGDFVWGESILELDVDFSEPILNEYLEQPVFYIFFNNPEQSFRIP